MVPLRIMLAAEESAGVKVLRSLLASEHEVVAVLTSEAPDSVRGATVWHVADNARIRILPAKAVRDRTLAAWMLHERVDLFLNVHSLYVVRAAILRAPRIGAFNLHPGPLPRYAGLNAPCWAIFHGESQHGVTVHWMVPKIDAGLIAYQTLFDIGPDDTGFTVSARCIREGVPLMMKVLESAAIDPESIPRIKQDLEQRTYFGRDIPFDGRIDWNRSAEVVHNFIRAASYHPLPSPWGIPTTRAGDEAIGVIRSKVDSCSRAQQMPGEVLECEDGVATIACKEGRLLVRAIHHRGKVVPPDKVLSRGMRLESSPEPAT